MALKKNFFTVALHYLGQTGTPSDALLLGVGDSDSCLAERHRSGLVLRRGVVVRTSP